jgi:hypothetical protein
MQRRVITLRSGFGPGGAWARSAVARKLHAPLRRVARFERQAITALRADGCSTGGSLLSLASTGFAGLLGLDDSGSGPGSGDAATGPQADVEGSASARGETSGDATQVSTTWGLPLGFLPEGKAADIALMVAILIVLLLAAGIWREMSSHRTAQGRSG